MTRPRPRLEGIIAAIPTPFRQDEELALDRLATNLSSWNRTRLAGYTALGTTGEFVSLTTDEKKRVLETAREHIPSDRVLLAGTGAESTKETVTLTGFAAEIGCDYAIVVTPHYNRRSFVESSLVDHYRRVADSSTIPVVVYHIPACTGLSLAPETVAKLAEHPNIVGIKDSSGDVFALEETKRACGGGFKVLTGSAQILVSAFHAGASGAILADANVAPEVCVDLWDACAAAELDRARKIQSRLVPFNRLLLGRYGIPGVKALLDKIGWYGGPPRAPLASVSEEAARELLQSLGHASAETAR
ncbi:MAG TPA: dihydrodipicolinate synthase family protein [Vicinamibacteria bacterium]|nr:dihydrodipicolinate synthase family protein [Vicinamibacteria bacterium]